MPSAITGTACSNRYGSPSWDCKREIISLLLNRRVLLGNKENLRQLMKTIIDKSAGMPIVAPLHTYVRNAIKELDIEAPNLHIMPPQNYLFFGYLINKAKGIITDSRKRSRRSDLPGYSLYHTQHVCRTSGNVAHGNQRTCRRRSCPACQNHGYTDAR